MNTTRYELTIDTSDAAALIAAITLFTNVAAAPSADSYDYTELTFDATDDAVLAYADRFDIPYNEITDVIVAVTDPRIVR